MSDADRGRLDNDEDAAAGEQDATPPPAADAAATSERNATKAVREEVPGIGDAPPHTSHIVGG